MDISIIQRQFFFSYFSHDKPAEPKYQLFWQFYSQDPGRNSPFKFLYILLNISNENLIL